METHGNRPHGGASEAQDPDERLELPGGAWLRWHPRWLDPGTAAALEERLARDLPWRQEAVTVFGRRHPQPRLTSWHGEPGCVYVYSGLRWDPALWTADLAALRDRVSAAAGMPFDTVLANLYRDGADSMGWHADDEPCFGEDPVIASVSLGAPRRFLLRHRVTGERREILLTPGSLLVMGGTTQRHWKHAVPKTRRPVGRRLSLTFRVYRH